MPDPLLPGRFLFRFAAPCLYRPRLDADEAARLDERHRLPALSALEGRTEFAEVRAAWNETGVAFSIRLTGKKQPPWCRANRPEDSDGLQLWLDTRDVHNVHRASRYCHRFIVLPSGGGSRFDEPFGQLLAINRAREQPHPVDPRQLGVRAAAQRGGYRLAVFVPAAALTGYDPAEHPRLGFTYVVLDRELGEQTFGVGSPLPYQEDPSLWATLDLVRAS
jgi:hypothetical protein